MRGLQAGAHPAAGERRELTPSAGPHADRAAQTWHDLLRLYVDEGRGGHLRVRDQPRRRSPLAALWPLSQVLAAGLHVARLAGRPDDPVLAALFRVLDAHRVGGAPGYLALPGQPPLYHDDNAWVGLDQVQAALVGVAPVAGMPGGWELGARATLTAVAAGQAPDGTVRWRDRPDSPRNTCATAPAVELALRLVLLVPDGPHRPALEAFARRADAGLTALLRRDDHLYADHVAPDGRVEHALWAYNQGTPVGADVLWWRLTGEPARLDRAEATARAALAHFDLERLWGHPPVFVAILLRNLFALHAARPLPEVLDVADAYLERVWRTAREPSTGAVGGGGLGRYDAGGVVDHAAVVQLLALRAWPAGWWPDIC